MALVKKAKVKETSTTTGTGTYTLAGAVTGFQAFSVIGNGNTCHYHATDGTNWEDGIGTYTLSGTTLARTTILESSNAGSAVSWSAGTKTLTVVYPASKAVTLDGAETLTNKTIAGSQVTGAITSSGLTQTTSRLLGRTTASTGAVEEISVSGATLSGGVLTVAAVIPGTCQGRLTLSSGNPVYDPQNVVAVSGQDTTNDTITVTSHGWTVGTMVYSTQTSGGLTALTPYYVGNVTANTVSLHTTIAAAVAGTSKVDITGTVTANIQAFGVANATIYLTPYRGKYIALYDGSSTWNLRSFSELSVTLSGLTSGLPYDVFVYDNAGTPALRALVAWTNGFTRATALTLQDGVYVKSGATTDLYVGTIYTTSTASTESSVGGALSQVGGKRFVWNNYNRISAGMAAIDTTATWSYTTDTWRQANGATGNKVEYVAGLNEGVLTANLAAVVQAVNHSARSMKVSIGINSTTSPSASIPQQYNPSASSMNFTLTAAAVWTAGIGYSYAAWMERGADTGSTYIGEAGNSRSALIASGAF